MMMRTSHMPGLASSERYTYSFPLQSGEARLVNFLQFEYGRIDGSNRV
jgi:hypothetical protein